MDFKIAALLLMFVTVTYNIQCAESLLKQLGGGENGGGLGDIISNFVSKATSKFSDIESMFKDLKNSEFQISFCKLPKSEKKSKQFECVDSPSSISSDDDRRRKRSPRKGGKGKSRRREEDSDDEEEESGRTGGRAGGGGGGGGLQDIIKKILGNVKGKNTKDHFLSENPFMPGKFLEGLKKCFKQKHNKCMQYTIKLDNGFLKNFEKLDVLKGIDLNSIFSLAKNFIPKDGKNKLENILGPLQTLFAQKGKKE